MFAAAMFALGFLAGWLVPRDAFPWMLRLSAWFMRNRRNDRLALGTIVFALLMMALAVLLSGCGMLSGVKPQRGGGASAQLGGTSAPTAVTIAQPENPGAASSQAVERQETRQTVVPVPVVKVTETPQPDGTVVRVTEQFQPQVVTSTTKEQTKSEIGAAQKDNAREVSAKLAAMRPVQFAGIAALAMAAAMFHPIVRAALGGGKTLQMYVGAAGLVLIFGPSLVAGNENLILIGALVLGGAVWGLNRLGHKEGQLDALARK